MLSSHYLLDLVDIAKFGAQSRVSLQELDALEVRGSSSWFCCCYSISSKGNESFVSGTTSSILVISSLFLFKTSHFLWVAFSMGVPIGKTEEKFSNIPPAISCLPTKKLGKERNVPRWENWRGIGKRHLAVVDCWTSAGRCAVPMLCGPAVLWQFPG
jgi:hypothetical protein